MSTKTNSKGYNATKKSSKKSKIIETASTLDEIEKKLTTTDEEIEKQKQPIIKKISENSLEDDNNFVEKIIINEEKTIMKSVECKKNDDMMMISARTTKSLSPDNINCVGIETKAKKKIKAKKNKKSETDNQNISVKSSFSKFDALQKRNLIHNPQGEITNCRICKKPVYKMEEVKAEKSVFHTNCFRCNACNKQLKMDNYQSHEGVFYCLLHFKLLLAPKCVEEVEPEKPRKPELIIRENQPEELPPDVVRASNKPDLGLEELHQLNVRSRFQVFENCTEKGEHMLDRKLTSSENIGIKRTSSILSKVAKLQALGVGTEQLDCMAIQCDTYADDSNNELSEVADDDDVDDIVLTHSKKNTKRERPVGLLGQAMNDIKTKFEKGHIMSKEERREERKQEIQNIRSRLFMGKQARIKEMYQQAVAESEQSITSTGKKPELEFEGTARTLMERFEKGEIFNENTTVNPESIKTNSLREEAEVFESAISKNSRNIFMELDANVAAQHQRVKPSNSQFFLPTKKNFSIENDQNDISIIKYDEIPEDIKAETSEISSKFKFFETYQPSESKRKEFRITPPREGVVKMPTPDSDGELVDSPTDINLLEKSHTTSMMLNKFREMEQNKRKGVVISPRPLKCFTPPPDCEHAYKGNNESDIDSQSEDEEAGEEDDEDNTEEYGSEKEKYCYDEALREAQNAARAKQLRAKFEKWEAKEVQRELSECRVNIYSQQVSDDTTIESTKTIRDRFENMNNSQRILPLKSRHQVNRFV